MAVTNQCKKCNLFFEPCWLDEQGICPLCRKILLEEELQKKQKEIHLVMNINRTMKTKLDEVIASLDDIMEAQGNLITIVNGFKNVSSLVREEKTESSKELEERIRGIHKKDCHFRKEVNK